MVLLHEIATFVGLEFVMRPERVVEGEVTMFIAFGILGIEESCHISNHIDAQFAVEVALALVEGSNSDTDFDTHK